MALLEYLMVYTESGLPIYSKCYGTFCKAAFKNPELLSGFLSALETIPLTMGGGMSLDSVRMGSTEMRFRKALPTGHSIVVGLSEDSPEVAEAVFSSVDEVLKNDRFQSADWNHVTSVIMDDFKQALLESALPKALHDYGGFKDECALGDQCPLHTTAVESRTQKVWSAIKGKYAAMRERMARKQM